MVGRICAMVSVIIPFYLVVVMAGFRGTLEVLPAILVCGLSFAGVQFYVSNYIGPELTDILSSLSCIGAMVLVLKLWKPRTHLPTRGRPASPDIRIAAHDRRRSSAPGCPTSCWSSSC